MNFTFKNHSFIGSKTGWYERLKDDGKKLAYINVAVNDRPCVPLDRSLLTRKNTNGQLAQYHSCMDYKCLMVGPLAMNSHAQFYRFFCITTFVDKNRNRSPQGIRD